MEIVSSSLFVFYCGVTSIALIAVLNLLLPDRMDRIREKLDNHLLRSFLLGLAAVVLLVGLGLLSVYLVYLPTAHAKDANGNFVGVTSPFPFFLELILILIALTLVVIATLGVSAAANSISQRIGGTGSAFHSLSLGALLLTLACLAPYLGWFVLAPFILCSGFGATLQVVFARRPAAGTHAE